MINHGQTEPARPERIGARERIAHNGNAAFIRGYRTGRNTEQRTLARSILAKDGVNFTGPAFEVDGGLGPARRDSVLRRLTIPARQRPSCDTESSYFRLRRVHVWRGTKKRETMSRFEVEVKRARHNFTPVRLVVSIGFLLFREHLFHHVVVNQRRQKSALSGIAGLH